MTSVRTIAITILIGLAALAAPTAPAAANPSGGAASASATTKEIEKTLGFVPDFVRSMPRALVPTWWHGMKALPMNPSTALPGKTKELIALGVAAAVPCEYCVYYHTEAARLHGASEQEIEEAVGMAALTRAGSTYMNGLQVDKAQFKRDVQRIVATARKGKR